MSKSRSLSDFDFTAHAVKATKLAAAPTAAAAFSAVVDVKFSSRGLKVRECRYSPKNPSATPVVLAMDATGSMGDVAKEIAVNGLPTTVKAIIERLPVPDPQIMTMFIDDVVYDQDPLQVTQFEVEAGLIIEQISALKMTQNGGGNGWESYNLAMHAAAFHTEADCWTDGRLGFLFIMGDELPPDNLTPAQLEKTYGNNDEICVTNEELVQALATKYHVFYFDVQHRRPAPDPQNTHNMRAWRELLGERAIPVTDYTKLPEIIVSLMQVTAGADPATVAKSWGGGTDLVVATAINRTGALAVRPTTGGGIVRV